jgi:hypothetical protein
MAKYCSFNNCVSKSRDGILIFDIPKNTESQHEWREFIAKSRGESVDKIKILRLCENHFSNDDLNRQFNPPRLRAGAVPVFVDKKVKSSRDAKGEFAQKVPIISNKPKTHEHGQKTDDGSSEAPRKTSERQKVNILNVEAYAKDELLNSLFDRVTELEKQLKNGEKLLKEEKAAKERVKNELEVLKKSLSSYFEKDQLDFMCGKRVEWSNATVQKGLMLRYKFGRRFYDESFRKNYAPYWPCSKTCTNRIKDFKLIPGILKFNINILGLKMQKVPSEHRIIGIIFDEKAIVPSLQKDHGINDYRGKVTLLPSQKVRKNDGDEPLAKHSLVALGVGSPVREKELLGLHYTAGASDGKAMADYMFELIKYVENNTDVKVQWIGMDLSPTNQSMLKAMGISLTQDNKIYKISHPNRPSDWLFILSDMAHDEKNIISKLRRENLQVAKTLVDQFDLSSSKVSFQLVKNIFHNQQEKDLKPAKRLKQENINPTQFEKMKQRIASEVLSSDVSSTLDYLEQITSNENKKNATAFFLQILLIFHNIIFDRVGWTIDEQKYQDAKEFLEWMVEDFLPNIKFGNNMKCIPGVIMSIRSLLEIAEQNFNIGIPKFIPAHYLNDAIENIFSLVNDIIRKPTAKSIADALRVISLRQFQFDPIKSGNCGWDNVEPVSIDIIGELKLFIENEDAPEEVPNIDEEIIAIEDEVTMITLFKEPLDRNVFYYEVSAMLNSFIKLIKCRNCQELLIDVDKSSRPESQLFEQRNTIEARSFGTSLSYQPSADLMTLFLRLEYIFQGLKAKIAVHDSKKFNFAFLESSAGAFMPNEHCFSNTTKIVKHFLEARRKISLHTYLPHKAIRNATKDMM